MRRWTNGLPGATARLGAIMPVDRESLEAHASQPGGDRACQQAGAHRLGRARARALDQDDVRGLDEQCAHVLVAALGDLAEDGAIAGQLLSRHQTEPGTEVAALLEAGTVANGGDDRAGNDRANARHRHQPLAALVLFGQRLDLGGDGLDALVEPPPVGSEVLEQTPDAWRDRRRIGGEDIDKHLAQGHRSLLHRDAAFDQEAADLVDGARALTHQARTHLVQGQQVHLLWRLDAHELHGRPLHGLGNRLRIPVVVLVAFEERLDVLRRDQAYVMAEHFELAADVVGP